MQLEYISLQVPHHSDNLMKFYGEVTFGVNRGLVKEEYLMIINSVIIFSSSP